MLNEKCKYNDVRFVMDPLRVQGKHCVKLRNENLLEVRIENLCKVSD